MVAAVRLFLLLVLLPALAGAVDAPSALPTPTGQYGVRIAGLTLRTQAGACEVVLYFPVPAGAEARAVPALPPAWRAAREPHYAKRYGRRAAQAIAVWTGHAAEVRDLSAALRGAPLLIFSPGLEQLPADYTILIEELVSRGFGIAAIVPNAMLASLPSSGVQARAGDQYALRAGEIAIAAAEFARMARTPGGPAYGRFDPQRIGAFGHSIGGAAAVLAADREPRITGAINLDGDFAGAAANAAMGRPVLYVTSAPLAKSGTFERWAIARSEARRDAVWRGLAKGPQHVRVRIGGAAHGSFLDAATLPPALLDAELRRERFGTLDGLRGIRLTADLVAAFFAPGKPALAPVLQAYPEIWPAP